MASDIKCPICGGKTTIRTAKKGSDAGKKFFVCDRYPECKGRIRKVDYSWLRLWVCIVILQLVVLIIVLWRAGVF